MTTTGDAIALPYPPADHRWVWRHRVGSDPATDLLVHGEGLGPA